MEAKTIGALVAILIVVIFAGYLIAGGITGFFVTVPAAGKVIAPPAETGKPPVDNETVPAGPPSGGLAGGTGGEPKPPVEEPGDPCEGLICPPINGTCPDRTPVSCQPGCDPLTGQCLTCILDCSGHQATGGGGGGSPPSGGGCTDTSWNEIERSGCSQEGKETVKLESNCGNIKTETRNCTYIPPNTTVWINPEIKQINLNDNITVDVKINTTEEVYAVEFELDFDSSIIEAVNGTEGNFLKKDGNTTYPVINISETVLVGVTRFNTQEGVSGEGTLATITFNAKGNGTSQVNLKDVVITDQNLQVINVSVFDGSVKVV